MAGEVAAVPGFFPSASDDVSLTTLGASTSAVVGTARAALVASPWAADFAAGLAFPAREAVSAFSEFEFVFSITPRGETRAEALDFGPPFPGAPTDFDEALPFLATAFRTVLAGSEAFLVVFFRAAMGIHLQTRDVF